MFKLVLEKAEEPEIKLPTFAGSSKTQESSRKTLISALLTMPKPLTVWITINCGKFFNRCEYQTTWSASWEICMQVRKQQLELDMEQPQQVLGRRGWSAVRTQNTKFVPAKEASPRKRWFNDHLTGSKWVPLTMRRWFLFTICFSAIVFSTSRCSTWVFFCIFYFSHNWVHGFL